MLEKCFIFSRFFHQKIVLFFPRKNALETHDVFPYRFFPRKNVWSPGVCTSTSHPLHSLIMFHSPPTPSLDHNENHCPHCKTRLGLPTGVCTTLGGDVNGEAPYRAA